ncbi:hypothetical protein PG993_011969 [Apiospora rasikravindrae]|uniref:F-box domain-containing protein n=1 Tax=Apiospora rasikravindrae TaxID=990691 RepID=A0ABR1S1L8_9PEZI
MADSRARNYFDRIPTEVLYLILGEFCGHCRGSSTGGLRDIYSGCHLSGTKGDELRPTFRGCVSKHYCEDHAAAAGRYRQDKENLASLCLVSKALRTTSQSVLHHFYMKGCKYSNGYRNAISDTELFRWIGLIPNTPPHVVRAVKSLSLGQCSDSYEQTWNELLPVTQAYGLMDFMCWSDDTKPPKFTNLEVLEKLIMTLPLLTNLSIGDCVTEWVEYDARFFQQIEELPLTSIDVWIDRRSRNLLRFAARIIELSRGLQTLKVDGSCISSIFGPPQPRLSLSRLRCLHLTRGRLGAGALQEVLSTSSTLQEFVYNSGPDPEGRRYGHGSVSDEPLDPSGLVRALEPCRSTLRTLIVWLDPLHHDLPDARSPDFADFPALQDLVLQWSVVCPSCKQEGPRDFPARDGELCAASQLLVGALPDSIRMLLIIDCWREQRHERLQSALDGLALAKSLDRFPPPPPPTSGGANTEFDAQNSIRDMFGASRVSVDYGLNWLGPGLPVPTAEQIAAVDERDIEGCTMSRHKGGENGYVAMSLPGEEEDDDL